MSQKHRFVSKKRNASVVFAEVHHAGGANHLFVEFHHAGERVLARHVLGPVFSIPSLNPDNTTTSKQATYLPNVICQ